MRHTLSAVDNNRLVLTPPKTRSSKGWVAISRRVATALRHRAADRGPSQLRAPRDGYVFHRPDGRTLHPAYVLNHFHYLCREFDLPRTIVPDLRHLAATISITAGVPLTVVSKTLRHSTLSTTANIYGHLTTQAAREAVGIIDRALTTADQTSPARIPRSRTPRTHPAGSPGMLTSPCTHQARRTHEGRSRIYYGNGL
ncbi:tyrosine recombinase XerC [Kitasatospora sp. NPDC056531]|uniref:site-specific integrase n=1 Tax=Kitasatospora sp. NPDC056531 TaxID=3345856 RepID=UPI0036B0B68D